MRIVMVAPFSVYPKGTVSIRMLPIATMLAKRGHNVSIVVAPYDNSSESGKEYVLEGVKIYNIKFRDFPLVKYPLTLISVCQRIFRLRPQCVYAFKPKGYSGLVAMFLASLKRFGFLKNLKLVLDSDDLEGYGGFSDYFRELSIYPKSMLYFFDFQERWIPKHVDAITVASRALETRIIERGISPDKVFYVPNGAPQRDFNVDDDEVVVLRRSLGLENVPVILLYTRFFEYKVEKVIEVLKCVKKELNDVKLLVIGKGEFGEEKKLEDLALREGLNDSVVFGGWIESKDIPKYLAIGDVAMYPFDDTPLNRAKCPGKLVELMIAKLAIVADRVGQIAEYIKNGESGILVDSDAPTREFALSIVKVLKNGALQRKLGVNSQNRILNAFNWAKLTDEVERAISFARKGTL